MRGLIHTVKGLLPSGYRELQYTVMEANSYLLTNIVPKYNYKIKFEWETTTLLGSAQTYLGARTGASGTNGFRVAHVSNKTFRVYGFGEHEDSTITCKADTDYVFTFEDQTATITTGDTEVFSYTFSGQTDNTMSMAIHSWNDNGNPIVSTEDTYFKKLKVRDEHGILIADYIPMKNNNNVAGVWDNVTRTFMQATEGTFTPGPEK